MKIYSKKLLIIGILIICSVFLFACNDGQDETGGGPRKAIPALAFKSDKTSFEIDDVTLTFYVGSENAGERYPGFIDYPAVTYIFFANETTRIPQYYPVSGDLCVDNGEIRFQYADGYNPKDLYSKIELDSNLSVCNKFYSSDADAFYKNNIVTLRYQDFYTLQEAY